VAASVARQVGLLPDGGTIYTGDDLAALSPEDLTHAVTTCNVFARVSPEQKFAIITALKAHAVVGYQGDGINDAPSLKLADVGIAVDAATEVAKANADIILLDKDLGVIINAITYGRTIFANINKYIKYTMVGNFGNFFALALLYLLSADLPLLPRQVLLISLLTDLPLIAISTDTVSSDELEQPDRSSARALLSLSLMLGTLTALFELAFFLTLHGQIASARQTSLYLFLSFTQLIVILSIRNRDHFWKAVTPSRKSSRHSPCTERTSYRRTSIPKTASSSMARWRWRHSAARSSIAASSNSSATCSRCARRPMRRATTIETRCCASRCASSNTRAP